MTYKPSFEPHHNFPKLAEESGFSFNTHKPRIHIEWNKIRLIDIDNLIRDRKFTLLELHINDILNCVLESEFDVRILDEGVLKIFRLSQLAVEYQQFCRNYLDRSVYVLREEVTNVLKELDITRKSLKEKEEEIRRLKRKPKHSFRTPLPYGNENIATMLLKTLNNNKGDIFGSTSHTDAIQYNKCSYCEKVFLNQLYLKSHISRRHPDCQEIPQRDTIEKVTVNDNVSTKLSEEVEGLKLKLKQMEDLIKKSHSHNDQVRNQQSFENNIVQNMQNNSDIEVFKETKDAEVLTDEDGNVNDKIDQWKKEEYEKYNKEIVLLRQQIIDIVNNKEKQEQSSLKDELKIMEQLQVTIKEQGTEILALKEELLKGENNEKDKQKDIKMQMSYWMKQVEVQSNEYKALLQKLNEVANEAREYRAKAEAEKVKSTKLQEMLQNHLSSTSTKETTSSNKNKVIEKIVEKKFDRLPSPKTRHIPATEDLITLSKLQQKAQELLNMNETSTGESSSASDENNKTKKKSKNETIIDEPRKYDIHKQNIIKTYDVVDNIKSNKNKIDKKLKKKFNSANKTSKKENGYVHIPNSPMKVVRAKLTEEVNNRLTLLGVDPLKNRLPRPLFQKQRMFLQKEQEIKAKEFPKREKILHSIVANLDKNTTSKPDFQKSEYISPSKSSKAFSLSSVLTNVKTKALSLVKSNESSNKANKSYNEVAKKAMALLRTPPGSAHSSPTLPRQRGIISPDKTVKKVKKSKTKTKRQTSELLTPSKKTETLQAKYTSDDENSESVEHELSKVVNNLVKSPIRYPTNIPEDQNQLNHISVNDDIGNHNKANDLKEPKKEIINVNKKSFFENNQDSSDDIESIDSSPRKFSSDENVNNLKQMKGVLKNASSMSSLNKKKVLFDLDAIQMKSISVSPSQSITEKSDSNEQYKPSTENFDTEEWDISSIENEPLKSAVKIQITSHTSPKIAELKQSIESQLTRRNTTLSTALVGGVDVLTAPIQKASFGGSNTSLGSSILDETDSVTIQNKKKMIKPKAIEKDDSEIEISDLINAAIDNKNDIKSY